MERTNINSYQLTAYSLKDLKRHDLYVDGSLNFGWNNYKGTRGIVFTGLNRSALSNYSGQQYAAAAGVGYKNLSHRGWGIVPHAGLRYTNLQVDAYTEKSAGGLGGI